MEHYLSYREITIYIFTIYQMVTRLFLYQCNKEVRVLFLLPLYLFIDIKKIALVILIYVLIVTILIELITKTNIFYN